MKKTVLALLLLVLMLPVCVSAQTETAIAKGFGGDVSVTLTVEDGMLTAVTAEGASETPTIGGLALEKLPAKMMEANAVNADIIAGATVTSNAILAAAQDALTAMGIELKAVETKAAATAALEDVITDVLVIGGGGAGMAAAVAAREEGKSVVLLEKLAMRAILSIQEETSCLLHKNRFIITEPAR